MKRQQEQALLAAFRLMDDDDREFMVRLALRRTAGRADKKPPLRLIVTNPPRQ